MVHMAEASNNGLKHLALRDCGITAEGAKSIADALKKNSTPLVQFTYRSIRIQ